MLKEIKDELRKGPTSIETLSMKFGISKGRTEDALRLLLSIGIVEEVPLLVCQPRKSPFCAFCPLSKSCGKPPIKMYRLKNARSF
ncbi:MAG: hypothetical protein DRN33_03875 [Thermoplasmata archaeon]|nr:MAG: hypothetical protein DRN33_03875 [Thermoplasmata archaeon]